MIILMTKPTTQDCKYVIYGSAGKKVKITKFHKSHIIKPENNIDSNKIAKITKQPFIFIPPLK